MVILGQTRDASIRHIQNVLGLAPLGWHFTGVPLVSQDITGEMVSMTCKSKSCMETWTKNMLVHGGPGMQLTQPAKGTRARHLHFRISWA